MSLHYTHHASTYSAVFHHHTFHVAVPTGLQCIYAACFSWLLGITYANSMWLKLLVYGSFVDAGLGIDYTLLFLFYVSYTAVLILLLYNERYFLPQTLPLSHYVHWSTYNIAATLLWSTWVTATGLRICTLGYSSQVLPYTHSTRYCTGAYLLLHVKTLPTVWTYAISLVLLSPKAVLSVNVVCLILILLVTSLITVVERKLLAITQRRYGPDVNGYVGMAQILADGLKLMLKSIYVTAVRHNNNSTHELWLVFAWPVLLFFIFSYILAMSLWAASNGDDTPLLFFKFVVLSVVAHYYLLLCTSHASSLWMLKAKLRGVYVFLCYDVVATLLWVCLQLPDAPWSIGGMLTVAHLACHRITPLGLLLLLWALLLESSRIPADVMEAESELVSGFNTEYAGMLYALLATSEYTLMLVTTIFASIVLLPQWTTLSICMSILCWFLLYMVIRSTLPRVRLWDLLEYLHPALLCWLFMVFLLSYLSTRVLILTL